MSGDFLRGVFSAAAKKEAIIWRNQSFTYQWLLDRIRHLETALAEKKIRPGSVVALEADFTPQGIASLLALASAGAIVAPFSTSTHSQQPQYLELARIQWIVTPDPVDGLRVARASGAGDHPLYDQLRQRSHAGLVLFSSGSTGRPKGVVHSFPDLLIKYEKPRRDYRTLALLLFDHIGGLDTLFYVLSNSSCLIALEDRSPAAVCAAIERHRVEVLPASPSFLRLLILSEAYQHRDLSSLKIVTYGAEVMPEFILRRCSEIFPKVQFQQKYGASEVGALRSKSMDSNSLWVKIGGDEFQTRVVDGILQIRAKSAMIGYLNAPNPFTPDGWFITGDRVEQQGEFLRILGRDSDLINVGGQKVFPAEVENVILGTEGVTDATVYRQDNAMMGQMVCARVTLAEGQSEEAALRRIRARCRESLEPYKIPMRIVFTAQDPHTPRYKKTRLSPNLLNEE